jgi:hypothetical protein
VRDHYLTGGGLLRDLSTNHLSEVHLPELDLVNLTSTGLRTAGLPGKAVCAWSVSAVVQ